MKILNLYDPLMNLIDQHSQHSGVLTGKALRRVMDSYPETQQLARTADGWEIDFNEAAESFALPKYSSRREVAREFIERAPTIVSHIEGIFGEELLGEIWLGPSLDWFDGFARFDLGSHRVIFGVDHPDANEAYLRALLAHELSHVYRDHRPKVWSHLGKPLSQVTRKEYLEAGTAAEHLISEGLATLFSQLAYPEVDEHVHHYYEKTEMQWCLDHSAQIEAAIQACLGSDENVWSFYGEERAGPGSPSRTHYFWAAQQIRAWLETLAPGRYPEILIEAHSWSIDQFTCFQSLSKTTSKQS